MIVSQSTEAINFYCGQADASQGQCSSPAGGAVGVAATAVTQAQAAAQKASAGGASGITIAVSVGGVGGLGGGPVGMLSNQSLGTLNQWTSLIAPQPGDNTNPIIKIQQFGAALLNYATRIFLNYFGFVIGIGFLATPLNFMGTSYNFLAGTAGSVLSYTTPLVYFILFYLISMGALLGVYVPLIPYMLFTFGAISWFIAAIEAMVAAPIVALGIIQPEGQHEILGKAEPAVMLLMSVFLRPTLMVFGMIGGMLLSIVVIKMINAAFYNVIASISSNVGVLEGFLFIMAYAGIVITALNKCFALIHVVPDQVLRWVQGPTGHGEEGHKEVKGTLDVGTKGVTKAISKGGSGAIGVTSAAAEGSKTDQDSGNVDLK